jgi:effector-binding domain-containing protein
MRLPVALTLIALATLSAGRTLAVDPTPDVSPAYTLTTPQPTHLASTMILYETIHVAPAQCAQPLKVAVGDLYNRLKTAHITPSAGPIIIFTSFGNPNTPTDIQVAVPVIDAPAAPPAGLDLRELPSVPSLTALYKGKFSDLSQAYNAFMQQMLQLNKHPAGELRQRTLYYESETSENNVVMIEIQTAE